MEMEMVWVYSSRLNDNLRYVIASIVNQRTVSFVDAIVDTGAMFTCFKAKLAEPTLVESDLKNNESKYIGGFASSKTSNVIKVYKYKVKQFTIGNIDLGKQDIWITFDSRVKGNLLGMDILKKINILQYN